MFLTVRSGVPCGVLSGVTFNLASIFIDGVTKMAAMAINSKKKKKKKKKKIEGL